jgi:hypothetical protein
MHAKTSATSAAFTTSAAFAALAAFRAFAASAPFAALTPFASFAALGPFTLAAILVSGVRVPAFFTRANFNLASLSEGPPVTTCMHAKGNQKYQIYICCNIKQEDRSDVLPSCTPTILSTILSQNNISLFQIDTGIISGK